MIKAVVDTNIFISGLISSGLPRKLIGAWEEGRFCLVTSNTLIEELISVINEPRFNKIIDETSGDRDLLEIGKYRSVKILSPGEFLNFLNKK